MSYDTSLVIDTGIQLTTVADCGNYTYNVSPMYKKAFNRPIGVNMLHGMTAKTAIPFLKESIEHMKQNAEEYVALNPVNKWGSYMGALEYLETILEACENHPLTQIHIS